MSYIWLLVIALVITAILTAVWRFTRIGWVTAAVSQNQRGAAALGISPGFVSSATWTVGAALAGVAGILVAPITQVSVGGLSLLVIPVMAAVLLGGFESFPATLASGLLIGVVQTVALNYNNFFEQHLHVTIASDSFPLLVVVAVMLLRGSSLPLRGDISERLPALGSGRIRWGVAIPAIAICTGPDLHRILQTARWSPLQSRSRSRRSAVAGRADRLCGAAVAGAVCTSRASAG